MPSTAPRRAAAPSPAPGVTRLGDAEVNFYLLEDPDGLVLVDGGLPGHLPQLQSHLEGAGHSLGDIRAVLLTHAHPDHTGAAAAARQAGADVWVHERDAAALAGGARAANRQAKPESSLLPYLIRRPATLRTIAYIARMGGFTGSKVTDPRTMDGDQRLDDVPGRPRVVTLPGPYPRQRRLPLRRPRAPVHRRRPGHLRRHHRPPRAHRRLARIHPRQPRGPRLPDGTRRHQRRPAAARPRRALPGAPADAAAQARRAGCAADHGPRCAETEGKLARTYYTERKGRRP